MPESLGIQFWVSLGAQVIIGVVGIYYQRSQLQAMSRATDSQPQAPLRYWPILAMLFCGAIAWTPWVIGRSQPESPPQLIGNYGIKGGFSFFMTVDTNPLVKYKKDSNLLMIVRVAYADIDRMADKFIEKSTEFTITGETINMALHGQIAPPKLRLSPNADTAIEYNLILLPKNARSENIYSLSDVEQQGGRILGVNRQLLPFSALGVIPQPTN
jgi:hypothetical protein